MAEDATPVIPLSVEVVLEGIAGTHGAIVSGVTHCEGGLAMDTIYIESRPCQDGRHEAWHDTEDGRTWLRFNSIAACMRYGEQYEFRIVVIRH